MMHRCSSDGHGNNMVGNGGPCCCGFFHSQNSPIPASPFSMIFSHKGGSCNNEGDLYSFASPAVDCTLSLGTPSTRFTSCHDHDHDHDADAEKMIRRSSNNCMSSNYLFHSNSHINQSPYTTSRGNANFGGGGETLLARRCANCDTTSTPLWRNGPKGPKSLCNACGIRYKKEERRATATAAAATGSGADSTLNNNSWVQHSQNQKASYMSNEFRFIQEEDDSTAGGIPFLSWRLNVTDRAGLIHNLTSI